MKCGIVGLPNVGKSTLFNALTATAAAEAANYPFCTIEPNVGRVGVPDTRLDTLTKIAGSQKIIPTQIEFVDIAGLIRGASKGEGLGNQFLGHIRSVDAILQVLRCFDDDDITHVEGGVDPLRDQETIATELMLADLESLEKRIKSLEKKKDPEGFLPLMKKVLPFLEKGEIFPLETLSEEDRLLFHKLQLLTSKPILYVCNVSEDDYQTGNHYTQSVQKIAPHAVIVSAALEAEIAQLDPAEQEAFLEGMNLSEKGLKKVIRESYALLNLITFFTVGPKEAHAWTIPQGSKAPKAAGVIHNDFERGFICAETMAYDDYVTHNGEAGAKGAGKWRQEGRDYVVNDGDIFNFRFNV